MATITKSAPLVALMALVTFAPTSAQAQDQRLRVSFAPAVATVSPDPGLALGGSFGYRFSERFWFEGELTWIDAGTAGFGNRIFDLDARTVNASSVVDLVQGRVGGIGIPVRGNLPSLPAFPISIGPIRAAIGGSTTIGTLGVRYELPSQVERFRPYLAAGLGINTSDQQFRLERTAFLPAFDESAAHAGYAFSAGAGASVRLAGQFWADVDAKYFRLSRDRNIMRLGGGVSVRF